MKGSFIKPNKALASTTRSFGQQAKYARDAAQRTEFKRIDGEFDAWYPREDKALWFAICPEQSWSFDLYDRQAAEAVHLEDQFYFAYVSHRVAVNKRSFQCSAGVHHDKPCWGCGVRAHFYDQKRIREEETGVKLQGEAPINAMTNYAFAGVLLETVAKVAKLDKHGKERTTKGGKLIEEDAPVTLLPAAEAKRLKAQGLTTFGKRVHYSVGISHLNTLFSFDDELRNTCANCGDLLTATTMACPDCGVTQEVEDVDGAPLSGQNLKEGRETDITCECGFFGPMVPLVECACGDPVEGKLVDFALRLRSEKTSDTARVLKLVEARPIKSFIEKHPEAQKLLSEPLALDEIFAPSSLQQQGFLVPETLRGDGISPAPRTKDAEPLSKPYPLGGTDEDDAE